MKNRKTATKLTLSSHHHNALYRLARGPVAAHGSHLVQALNRFGYGNQIYKIEIKG